MILEEATYEAFGYYAKDLTSGSHKLIITTCTLCGEFRIIEKHNYQTFCKPCSQKGRKHTKATKQKICDAQKGNKNHAFGKRGPETSNWKGGKVKCICKKCKKVFYAEKNQIESGRGIYCSRSCCSIFSNSGKKNGNWRGGISFGQYCIKFNDEYRQKIRGRFGNKCFLCNKTEAGNGRKLDVHHINYNKNCGCDNSACVCVPLCHSCHMRTGADRDYWQTLITEMLKPEEAWM